MNEGKKLVNIRVNETTLKAWKQFCLDNDATLSATVKRAMNEFIAKEKERNTKGVILEKVDNDKITLQLSKDTLQKLVAQ